APVSSPSPALRQTARHRQCDVCPPSSRADYECEDRQSHFPERVSSCSRSTARDRSLEIGSGCQSALTLDRGAVSELWSDFKYRQDACATYSRISRAARWPWRPAELA